MYKVEFSERALKQIKKFDRNTTKLLMAWIRKNLEGCSNPRAFGKSLTANHSGQWRYRVGDYRIIAEIEDNRVVILVINIGHRRDIYKL